jgi:hypothetical protein
MANRLAELSGRRFIASNYKVDPKWRRPDAVQCRPRWISSWVG